PPPSGQEHGAATLMIKDGVNEAADLSAGPLPVLPRGEDGQVLSRLPAVLAKRQRGWELGLPAYVEAAGRTPPIIIAVGAAKGGVGSRLSSANRAVRLAWPGLKVLAVALDVGGANLHTYFGVPTPKHGLADALVARTRSFLDVAVPTSIDGVRLVAG